jgi:hypothetical protein
LPNRGTPRQCRQEMKMGKKMEGFTLYICKSF